MLLPYALLLATLISLSEAHMTAFLSSMYAEPWTNSSAKFGSDYNAANPLGPGWKFDDWWFRGAMTRASPPPPNQIQPLPAGGQINLEIACHIAFTTLGGFNASSNVACPGNNGAYHSGDPNGGVDPTMLQGCALAIADVDDINKVTMDNLVVFSVQKQCVWNKNTTFDVPTRMPKCKGSKCICAWMWLPANGTGNFYMTGFNCAVTNVKSNALPISMPLKDPVPCYGNQSACVKGAKRPIYSYNDIWNVPWIDNYHRPGYDVNWGWFHGAQDDIFVQPNKKQEPKSATTTSITSKRTSTITTRVSTSTTKKPSAGAQTVSPINVRSLIVCPRGSDSEASLGVNETVDSSLVPARRRSVVPLPNILPEDPVQFAVMSRFR